MYREFQTDVWPRGSSILSGTRAPYCILRYSNSWEQLWNYWKIPKIKYMQVKLRALERPRWIPHQLPGRKAPPKPKLFGTTCRKLKQTKPDTQGGITQLPTSPKKPATSRTLKRHQFEGSIPSGTGRLTKKVKRIVKDTISFT